MASSASDKIRRFYKRFAADDRVLIVINADPDAIASAIAVKRLLWRKVANVTVANINLINRPDNIAMIRLLGISLTFIDEVNTEPFTRFVVVDSQPDHNEIYSRFKFDVIIDHHPEKINRQPEKTSGSPFKDIRPHYGATATILTEYLRAAKIKPSAKLATALFHAIKTDTSNFERQAVPEDMRAFQFLFQHANIHLARKIERSELRIDFLAYFNKALAGMRMRRGRIFVYLGPVVNPDVCVLIADFFMRVNPVKWSIISGIYSSKLILILRNDGLHKNAGKVAEQSFGHIGSAGGHKSMARAEISVENLTPLVDIADERSLLKWIIDRIEKKAGGK